MAFPAAPGDGDTHDENGRTYQYVLAVTTWIIIPTSGGLTANENGRQAIVAPLSEP